MKTFSLTTLIVLIFLSDLPTLFSQENPVSLIDKLYKQTSIAFASRRDGNFEIYIMNSDGSKPKDLTNNPAKDEYPSWSPDGKKIAFYSLRKDVPDEKDYGKDGGGWFEYNSEIYVMNAEGSDLINLTNNPAYDGYPNWSPFFKTEK